MGSRGGEVGVEFEEGEEVEGLEWGPRGGEGEVGVEGEEVEGPRTDLA